MDADEPGRLIDPFVPFPFPFPFPFPLPFILMFPFVSPCMSPLMSSCPACCCAMRPDWSASSAPRVDASVGRGEREG